MLFRSPQVLFTDIHMPGLNGIELLQTLSQEQPEIRTVLISNCADFSYAQSAVRYRAFDFLLKPIDQEELSDVLVRLFSQTQKTPAVPAPNEGIKPHVEGSMALKPCSQAAPQEQPGISGIIQEIQSHYMDNLSLQQLAEKHNISSGHLSFLLKKELGVPFSKYITSKRMQFAKQLLKHTKLSIDDIAYQTGYHDYFYFTKVFRETQGISPSKYRKKM